MTERQKGRKSERQKGRKAERQADIQSYQKGNEHKSSLNQIGYKSYF